MEKKNMPVKTSDDVEKYCIRHGLKFERYGKGTSTHFFVLDRYDSYSDALLRAPRPDTFRVYWGPLDSWGRWFRLDDFNA